MKTLEIDSLTPSETFDADIVAIRPVICGTPGAVPLRPRWEVAALLALSGVTSDVLSEGEIAHIEARALRRLRRDRGIRRLYREAFGRAPAMA
jgi:hypothetical protein